MSNIPNHAQAARIAADLRTLAKGLTPDAWRGNSYDGRTRTTAEGIFYILRHWNTDIATFAVVNGQVRLVDFRAHYYSSTTRSFQGRILRGMSDAQVDDDGAVAVAYELSQPTHNRGHLVFDLALNAHTIVG